MSSRFLFDIVKHLFLYGSFDDFYLLPFVGLIGHNCWALFQWDIYFRVLVKRTSKIYECSLFKWRAPRSFHGIWTIYWARVKQIVCNETKDMVTLPEHRGLFPVLCGVCLVVVVHSWLPLLTFIYNSSWYEPHYLEMVSLQKKGITHILSRLHCIIPCFISVCEI